ncbi:MAG: hypothetical protein ACI379_14260 [Nocardioides sp.]|uniref:hypothetical protein n=1 Tax=Nocardioides sp. TaxID=35761 RepID=UPI003F0AEDD5
MTLLTLILATALVVAVLVLTARTVIHDAPVHPPRSHETDPDLLPPALRLG